MARLWLKDCPRCRGDRYLDEGIDGLEMVCLQCGYRVVSAADQMALRSMRPVVSRDGLRTPLHSQEGALLLDYLNAYL